MSEYDVIVVGAGVEGSSTAYNLVKNGGGRVLLLEQFSSLNTHGSSHGGSRCIKRVYNQPHYVQMVSEAFKMWSEIERESGVQLYHQTGIIMFGPRDSVPLNNTIKSATANGIEYELLNSQEANGRYPHLKLPPDYLTIFEKSGGLLPATKSVEVIQNLFVKFGGVLLDHHCVTEIIPGDTVTVKTDKGDFTSKKIVITAGAWALKIMEKLGVHLPFKTTNVEVLYWKLQDDLISAAFPMFALYDLYDVPFYGVPSFEYPGLIKVCLHGGTEADPDQRNDHTTFSSVERLQSLIKEYFRGVDTSPSICVTCMYTESPDKNPVLDRHPLYHNIVFGAGFSGHGFKHAPVVGRILTELALDLPPSLDLSPFKLSRFSL